MSDTSTLKKLVFENLDQFLIDINQQFAVIQNSPLFKGIPGLSIEGEQGVMGERGSKFLFVSQFVAEFPLTFPLINLVEDVDINFLNATISNFNQNKILLDLFGIEKFIDGDNVVLSNTGILTYSKETNTFLDTNIFFNEETNLQQNLKRIVNNLINNALKNLTVDILNAYPTLGKNFSDNNSLAISDELLPITAFSPYIQGFNSNNGLNIKSHKFYSYSDISDQNFDDTLVLGNIKSYYRKLHRTITNEIDQNFNSNYVPGVNNIPKMILQQNDKNSGFYFGHDDSENLFGYASLYKDDKNNVILKSHSSPLNNEFSFFSMSISELYYNKDIRIDGDFIGPVGRILKMFNETSLFAGSLSNDKKSENVTDWDFVVKQNAIYLNSSSINLDKFKPTLATATETILGVDDNGKLTKKYFISNVNTPGQDIPANAIITGAFLNSNYYTKHDWANNKVDGINIFNDKFKVTSSIFDIGLGIKFNQIKSSDFLSTSADGTVIDEYKIYKSDFDFETFSLIPGGAENLISATFDAFSDDKKVVTNYAMFKTLTNKFIELYNSLFNRTAKLLIDSVEVNSINQVGASGESTFAGDIFATKAGDFKVLTTDIDGKIVGDYLIPRKQIERANTTTGLNNFEYLQKFLEDPIKYDYSNLVDAKILGGIDHNHIMNILRNMIIKFNNTSVAFDREVKFIPGTLNINLTGSNWWLADGTNSTDDMRGVNPIGAYSISASQRVDATTKIVTRYPRDNNTLYNTIGTQPTTYVKLDANNIPTLFKPHPQFKWFGAASEDIPKPSSGQNFDDNSLSVDELGLTGYDFDATDGQQITQIGIDNNARFSVVNPYIVGTWIQYLKPDDVNPEPPTNLSINNISSSSAILTFSDAVDNVGISAYNIFLDGIFMGSTTTNDFAFSNLSANTNYVVGVVAIDPTGNESTQATTNFTTEIASISTTPSAPTINNYIFDSNASTFDISFNYPEYRSLDSLSEPLLNFELQTRQDENYDWVTLHIETNPTIVSTPEFAYTLNFNTRIQLNNTENDYRIVANVANGLISPGPHISQFTRDFSQISPPQPVNFFEIELDQGLAASGRIGFEWDYTLETYDILANLEHPLTAFELQISTVGANSPFTTIAVFEQDDIVNGNITDINEFYDSGTGLFSNSDQENYIAIIDNAQSLITDSNGHNFRIVAVNTGNYLNASNSIQRTASDFVTIYPEI